MPDSTEYSRKNKNLFLRVILHVSLMVVLVLGVMLLFFYVWLPANTRHGSAVAVPDIKGMNLTELEDYLTKYQLRYEVNDSLFSSKYPPLTVLSQYPKPGAVVKRNRKIYIAVNPVNPPKVKMPNLKGRSLKSAELMLKSHDLRIGKVIFVPDIAKNTVLNQQINGKDVDPGDPLPKGTKIDLLVSDGYGNTEFDIPNLVGMKRDHAEFVILGQGLQTGSISYVEDSDQAPGTIIRQNPAYEEGKKVRAGDVVDLWIAGKRPGAAADTPRREKESDE